MTEDREQRAKLPVPDTRNCAELTCVKQHRPGASVNSEIAVWLGIAVLALVWANLGIWRARRVLSQSRQEALVQDITLLPYAVTMPAIVTEASSPALAS
jgi:hypothetical protein